MVTHRGKVEVTMAMQETQQQINTAGQPSSAGGVKGTDMGEIQIHFYHDYIIVKGK